MFPRALSPPDPGPLEEVQCELISGAVLVVCLSLLSNLLFCRSEDYSWRRTPKESTTTLVRGTNQSCHMDQHP
jgi:hypothetical protein